MSFLFLIILAISSSSFGLRIHSRTIIGNTNSRWPTPTKSYPSSNLNMNSLENTPFESLYTMVKAREACPPQVCIEQLVVSLVRQMNLPDFVLHWFHPIAMVLALASLGGYGVYQGYLIRKIRIGTSPDRESLSVIKTAQSLHPTLMSILLFVIFIGAQGGLSSLLVQEHPILESSHSATTLLVFLMLGFQAALSVGMPSLPILRTVHTYFGAATVAAILIHFATGLSLGFSL